MSRPTPAHAPPSGDSALATSATDALRDRFRGVLLGTFCGDALGMPLEGLSRAQISARHGGSLSELVSGHGREAGSYTDDTQLTLALAQAIVDSGGQVSADAVALAFGEAFERQRGYGGAARRILLDIRDGRPWRVAVDRHGFKGGSHGNGSAMRVAPVALACLGDVPALLAAAAEQGVVTAHTHWEAVAGAQLQALAVHEALRRGLSGSPLLAGGQAHAFTDVLRRSLDVLPRVYLDALGWIDAHLDASPAQAAEVLGTGVYVGHSVPTALWAVLSCADAPGPEAAIVRAANLGGDADTIAAMAGAIAGAYWGASALPARWLAGLEQGRRGRDHAVALADALADLRLLGALPWQSAPFVPL